MIGQPSDDKPTQLSESYPPFAAMAIRLLELDGNGRQVRILTPLKV